METYVLSILGADRSGLVAALSEVVAAHGGSWDRSQMTQMAGMFAGMVQVRVPAARAEAFRGALGPLRDRGLLDVTLRAVADDAPVEEGATVSFEVVAADRTGIVHEVATLLSSRSIGIVDLRTWTASAAMAGEDLFHAAAVVRLPADMDRGDLVAAFEGLGDDLMIDLHEA